MSEVKRNVISFINMKGGVGKTTLCKEIAYTLSKKFNKKILIFDVDPQCNLTQSFLEKYKVIKEDETITSNPLEESIENLLSDDDFLGHDPYTFIHQFDKNIHLVPGEMTTRFTKRGISASGSEEQRILTFIKRNDLRNSYDYIFIDCPPTHSFHTNVALIASDFFIVPVKPDTYSILGLNLLLELIEKTVEKNTIFDDKPLDCLGVVYTMFENNGKFLRKMKSIDRYLENKNIYRFDSTLKRYTRLSTGKLSTFIIDRKENSIVELMMNICNEFERRYNNETIL